MNDFFRTLMGRKYYEADVPRIAKALERIAGSLEKIAKKMEAQKEADKWAENLWRGVLTDGEKEVDKPGQD